MQWTAVATGYATAECVGVRKAGRGLCVSRRLATLSAARMESARRESVSVTKDGRETTVTLVSGPDREHTHTNSFTSSGYGYDIMHQEEPVRQR